MGERPRHLFLFDVDSVLVEAIGYLRALQDTVAHFTERLGAGRHPPTDAEARTFEAQGLTSEWDSGAACVGLVLVDRMAADPALNPPGRWTDAETYLAARPCSQPRPDYLGMAVQVGARLNGSTTVARAARAYLEDRFTRAGGRDGRQQLLSQLLDELIGHTHDFYRAPVTRYLQHLVIGSAAVPETYGVDPDFECGPYLLHHDRSLLAPSWRSRVCGCIRQGLVGASIYTARPSLPPVDIEASPLGFSPEAEAARSLVGLEGMPLIGEGKVRWLAAQNGEEVERLVKPSPVQALAAIGAASTGCEARALQSALALVRDGRLEPPLSALGPVTVHVFEDTVGGLAAVERAVGALQGAGLAVGYQPYGVVRDGPKVEAMAGRDVPTFGSIDHAVAAALGELEAGQSCCSAARLGAAPGG